MVAWKDFSCAFVIFYVSVSGPYTQFFLPHITSTYCLHSGPINLIVPSLHDYFNYSKDTLYKAITKCMSFITLCILKLYIFTCGISTCIFFIGIPPNQNWRACVIRHNIEQCSEIQPIWFEWKFQKEYLKFKSVKSSHFSRKVL